MSLYSASEGSMTHCYSILGVPHSATAAEIRVAYLAKMKALHPDAAPDMRDLRVTASDITYAYWQLRDPHRRAQHDEALRLPKPRRPGTPAISPSKIPVRRAQMSLSARNRRSARLQPVRVVAGALAFSVAAAGFVLAFTYLQPEAAGPARAASVVATDQPTVPVEKPTRRLLDPVLVESAGEEFRSILRTSGFEGAHLYGRQCLAQLTAHPSLSMLDYCLAFDDAAADWEIGVAQREPVHRFFDEQQRFARYHSVSRSMREASVRAALKKEVTYFASLQADPSSARTDEVTTRR